MKFLRLAVPFLTAQAIAVAIPDTHIEHERQDVHTFSFQKRSRLQDMTLPVRIG